jgi:hypothetical protein
VRQKSGAGSERLALVFVTLGFRASISFSEIKEIYLKFFIVLEGGS